MKQAQYDRILQKLEKAAKLMQDPKRASAAGRLLVYPNCEELQNDVNELLKAFKENQLFMLDTDEMFEGAEALDLEAFGEIDFSEYALDSDLFE